MTYPETLSFLYSQLPMYQRVGKAAYKTDLSNTLALDAFFRHPHRHFKSIHIAGTNGKGSIAHMLAAIFQSAGYKTGLYTSPHLKDFRERIKINGSPVSKDFVVQYIERSKTIIEKIKPSFFELTVLMAFDYFAQEKIDIAIIETGMGGRLDSTNIITPLLSIITNIAYDHTYFLGNTLPEIAKEKAGIIKTNVPVIIGEKHPETMPVFQETAHKKNTKIIFAEDCFTSDYMLEDFSGKVIFNIKQNGQIIYPNIILDLSGNYQKKNLITILCTLETIRNNYQWFTIGTKAIYNGLENVTSLTGFAGRWQVLQHNPLIVLDIAHNENGLSAVFEQVRNTPYRNLHIVMGFVDDKSVDTILKLFPQNATYYFTQAQIPRALPVEILQKKAKSLNGNSYPKVKDAFLSAKKNASRNDMILVTGSTFIVAEIF